MNCMVEISMYPLQEDFIPPIDAFLELLNAAEGVEVTTNRMSTLVHGDYRTVMNLLMDAMEQVHAAHGQAAFSYKVLPGAERSINGYE